jgi:DNA-3-methyladenine glycosylase I
VNGGLIAGDEGLARCWWGAEPAEYRAYHDGEWGRASVDDRALFEKLCLEGFQAGLSWLTILRKREAFRSAFAGFDPGVVARYGEGDVRRLLGDASIVRHEAKIRSTINNAARLVDLVEAGGSLAALVWPHADPPGSPPPGELPATTPASTALSKELKRRGWTFVGPTTIYAFMQAMGLVDDHLGGCHARDASEASRRRAWAARPGGGVDG